MFSRFLPILALASMCSAQCSLDALRGNWAVYTQVVETITPPGSSQAVAMPYADLELFTIDWNGNFSTIGKAAGNLGGQSLSGTISGSINVTSDCIGSLTYTLNVDGVPAPLTGSEQLVVVNGGKEIRAMATGGSAGAQYWYFISRGDPPSCSADAVHGVYVGTYGGYVATPSGSATASAIVAVGADYQGRVTGGGGLAASGVYQEFTLADSTVTVNADCTGTVTRNIVPEGASRPLAVTEIDKMVVLNNGEELILMGVQSALGNPTYIGKLQRVSTIPVTPSEYQ